MAKYRKKPVIVDAFQWTGGRNQTEDPEWVCDCIKAGLIIFRDGAMLIETLEGVMQAKPGDYIIRGVQGEIYPCKADIFKQTYERVI
ncbi:hypothetical protein [Paenibacillus popilliae]|uniref:Aminopeptidase N n=1 Tax=Paenibacillus popilliae ATCC 14706 TaxID=1212764 RepID=M9L786_PAEPP|nr:hypothetical protein [Paenibacillus popilliae]GAC40752.1 aminopeptidase N [Paenibacillus popilliae ATCC 14706]